MPLFIAFKCMAKQKDIRCLVRDLLKLRTAAFYLSYSKATYLLKALIKFSFSATCHCKIYRFIKTWNTISLMFQQMLVGVMVSHYLICMAFVMKLRLPFISNPLGYPQVILFVLFM